jgi:hypothetical protein
LQQIGIDESFHLSTISWHDSDYAESFTGSSCNHALTAVELGIIRDSA